VSTVVVPLPEFPLAKIGGGCNDHFLARVELEAEMWWVTTVMQSTASASKRRLNHVFEKADLV
jgi:hypothetical protein